MKKWFSDNKTDLIAALLFFTLVSIVLGAIQTMNERDKGGTGCKYETIASYSPPYALTCELLRKRWCDERKDGVCK